MTCWATVALRSLRFRCFGLLCKVEGASCTQRVRQLMCTASKRTLLYEIHERVKELLDATTVTFQWFPGK